MLPHVRWKTGLNDAALHDAMGEEWKATPGHGGNVVHICFYV
jgi:hypothetical protein